MTTSMYGADVAQLRQLAQKFDRAADQLETATAQLGSQVGRAPAWIGPDAVRFRSEWSGTSVPKVRAVVTEIRNAATALMRNAEQQELTSAADGGTASITQLFHSTLDSFSVQGASSHEIAAHLMTMLDILKGVGSSGLDILNELKVFGDNPENTKLLGPLGILSSAMGIAVGVREKDYVAVGGEAIGGLISSYSTVARFVPKIAAPGLGVVGAGIVALQGFIQITEPTTPQQVDSTYAKGVEHEFGTGVDPNHLTTDQSQRMIARYSSWWGPMQMISDTMDASADKIFPWNWNKKK